MITSLCTEPGRTRRPWIRGGFADGNYRILSRTLDGNDVTHRVTLSGVYYLPVGRGRRFLGSSNRLVDAAIGGWELAALYIYETGHPWSFGGLDYMHNAKTPQRPDPRVPGSIRGANPCVGEWNLSGNTWSIVPYQVTKNLCSDVLPVANYVDFNFVSQPPYGPQPNIVYSGIRIPNYYDIDTNLSKNFHPTDRVTVQLRLDAFNVLNHPIFQQNYDGNPNDEQFGTILRQGGQSNVPRQTQLTFKVIW